MSAVVGLNYYMVSEAHPVISGRQAYGHVVLFIQNKMKSSINQFLLGFHNSQFLFKIFSIDFFSFLVSASLISALIFMIQFLLLTLGFACSFSGSFRYKVRLMRFFLFPKASLHCYKLYSQNCFCCILRGCGDARPLLGGAGSLVLID